jgi:hypothetical protein
LGLSGEIDTPLHVYNVSFLGKRHCRQHLPASVCPCFAEYVLLTGGFVCGRSTGVLLTFAVGNMMLKVSAAGHLCHIVQSHCGLCIVLSARTVQAAPADPHEADFVADRARRVHLGNRTRCLFSLGALLRAGSNSVSDRGAFGPSLIHACFCVQVAVALAATIVSDVNLFALFVGYFACKQVLRVFRFEDVAFRLWSAESVLCCIFNHCLAIVGAHSIRLLDSEPDFDLVMPGTAAFVLVMFFRVPFLKLLLYVVKNCNRSCKTDKERCVRGLTAFPCFHGLGFVFSAVDAVAEQCFCCVCRSKKMLSYFTTQIHQAKEQVRTELLCGDSHC